MRGVDGVYHLDGASPLGRVMLLQLAVLAQLYGVGAPEADTLLRLAREANQRGWWAAYGDTVPDWVRTYVG